MQPTLFTKQRQFDAFVSKLPKTNRRRGLEQPVAVEISIRLTEKVADLSRYLNGLFLVHILEKISPQECSHISVGDRDDDRRPRTAGFCDTKGLRASGARRSPLSSQC